MLTAANISAAEAKECLTRRSSDPKGTAAIAARSAALPGKRIAAKEAGYPKVSRIGKNRASAESPADIRQLLHSCSALPHRERRGSGTHYGAGTRRARSLVT